MMRPLGAALLALALVGAVPAPHQATLKTVPNNAQTAVVTAYLRALQHGSFRAAYALLNADAHAYYRNSANFASIFAADTYRIRAYTLLGVREGARGSVYFARETATYHDHAHDVDLTLSANVPVGVVLTREGWRIKDPGHPWRAFAAAASAQAHGLRVTVKKLSFFARRIEVLATFTNVGAAAVTVLPYGKSALRDDRGTLYRIIETNDWSLTDKALFTGLRLPPNAAYTGVLMFACRRLDNQTRTFSLRVGPALIDGGDVPFSLDIANVRPPNGAFAQEP